MSVVFFYGPCLPFQAKFCRIRPKKWHEYRDYCDRLFFATSPDVPQEIFPEETGFILADDYMAEIIREAPEHKLSAATRKAVILRFAQAAANRLHDLTDPNQRNLRRG
ncbi:hypothetical protein PsAD26_00353 [Pseudovibrio sp. Ad26]|nr:hypothetical protein PsAD26_00353 [Pseudovibrio sp. Ad26]